MRASAACTSSTASRAARDFRYAPFAQFVRETGGRCGLQRLPRPERSSSSVHIAQVGGANAGRVECLDDFQDPGNFFTGRLVKWKAPQRWY